jgi:hypothetical protein
MADHDRPPRTNVQIAGISLTGLVFATRKYFCESTHAAWWSRVSIYALITDELQV